MVDEFPTQDEIWAALKNFLGTDKFVETRKLEDPLGVYLWEVQRRDADGGITEYSYKRKGSYPEGSAEETHIDEVFLDKEGNPIGGSSAAKFIDGKWVKT